jgi:hypothetical protein
MKEKNWLPSDIGRLTVGQLVCLLSEKPPGNRTVRSAEEYQKLAPEW